jgi:2-methylisoborneol synthase
MTKPALRAAPTPTQRAADPASAPTATAVTTSAPASGSRDPTAAQAAIRRLPTGPTGLGTSAARLSQSSSTAAPPAAPTPTTSPPAASSSTTADDRTPPGTAPATKSSLRIPKLYCPDARRDDPALGEEVNERLLAWAAETGIYAGRLEKLRAHQFGRLFMLAHPNCDDPDRLMVAARCGLAEWSVDDHWVDEGEDADPKLLGSRLAMAHAVVDPVRLPARYQGRFEEVAAREPVLRAFRSCLAHLAAVASPIQVARLRHELSVMFVGYGQEAEWRSSERRPAVWEYLAHRWENAFYPCMVLIDPVDGYELPAHESADQRVRRTYLYAGVANVLLNDIYSMAKEDPTDTNLPNLIVAEDGCSVQEAVDRAAAIHDEMMHTVEAECAALSTLGSPELGRYLTGLWDWMGGSKQWHATSARYNIAGAE